MKHKRPKHGRSREATSNLALKRTKATTPAKHQESQCTVCRSPHRAIIERSYLDGFSERALAQIYGMSDSAIHRHAFGTDLNRLRQTDTEIYYLRVMVAAQKKLTGGVTVRDGLRAAERLDKIRCLEKEPRKREDPERLQVLLEERIQFGIEGFKRGGVLLTRRDMLELFKSTPESAGVLYPLILDELERTKEPLLIEDQHDL